MNPAILNRAADIVDNVRERGRPARSSRHFAPASGRDARRPARHPVLIGIAGCALLAAGPAARSADANFQAFCTEKAAAAAQAGTATVAGRDGWLFLDKDLRHAGHKDFTAAFAGPNRDPVPAIADFAKQLAAGGTKLILVPVPPKPLVQAAETGGPAVDTAAARAPVEALYAKLKERGVTVVDLFAAFRAAAADGKALVYCRTDTHWSGRGCELAAAALAAAVRDAGVPAGKVPFKAERREMEIAGDLAGGLAPPAPKEKLDLGFVSGADGAAPADDRASPILLLGDSHVLVFHAGGDMHAQGAGLADHLAKELAAPVDVLGVRGSGATACRVSLYRRSKADPAYLAGKKLVIWCLAEREFTEADGWRAVPVK